MDRNEVIYGAAFLLIYTLVVAGVTIALVEHVEQSNPDYGPVSISINGTEAYLEEGRIVKDYPDRFVYYKQNGSLYRINIGNFSTSQIEEVGFVTKVYIITDIPGVV